jgi:teichuronic acid biosynthesis glycosyltransferase TuaC
MVKDNKKYILVTGAAGYIGSVVSVSVGDVPEVIGGTDGCYLCTQDPADVAEKLVIALSQPKRTNGRENIKHLEQGAIARRIMTVYQEVLHENKRGI